MPQEQTNSTFYNKISPLIKKSVFRSSETRNPTRHSLLEMSFNFESIKNSDNDEESFEEESLIDRQKPEKDENFDDSVFLKNKSKCNIVETIDPTFKQTKSSLQSKFSSVEMKASSAMSKVSSSNLKYEVCCDDDTDSFLPVQGQRRPNGQCKTSKKKKTSGQCIQQ